MDVASSQRRRSAWSRASHTAQDSLSPWASADQNGEARSPSSSPASPEDDLRRRIAPHIHQLKTAVAQQRTATSAATAAAREAMGMFWQASHVLLLGFPALDTDLSARPGEGERLGPLRLQGRLGHGTFGTVLAATKEATKEKEAVKVIKKDGISDVGHVKSVWKEIHVLGMLKHENIIAYYGALQGPDHIYIRMELLAGGNLYRALKASSGDRFCGSDAQRCQAQLGSAIQYCHGMRVAHCDLKPENLGLCNCTPLTLKVLDLGSARRTDSECRYAVGTIPFMAPEVLEASSAAPFEPAGSDNFACGVILLEMLCGVGKLNSALGWQVKVRPSPALATELRDLLRDTAGLAAALEEDVGVVRSELHHLLAGLLRANPVHRWSAAKALRSSWLQQGLRAEAVSR